MLESVARLVDAIERSEDPDEAVRIATCVLNSAALQRETEAAEEFKRETERRSRVADYIRRLEEENKRLSEENARILRMKKRRKET